MGISVGVSLVVGVQAFCGGDLGSDPAQVPFFFSTLPQKNRPNMGFEPMSVQKEVERVNR